MVNSAVKEFRLGIRYIHCSCTAPRILRHLMHLDIALDTAFEAPMIQYPLSLILFAVIPLPWCCTI